VVSEVSRELRQRVDAVISEGVDPALIVLDPGLGFGKLPEHNWALLTALDRVSRLDTTGAAFPVLVGASRKRFLSRLLAAGDGTLRPFSGCDDATVAVTALAAVGGAWCARVHQVVGNADAVKVAQAWRRAGSPAAPREASVPGPASGRAR
jgi:dihydropteroate synthase